MIEATARGAWQELDAKVRPFVARRVRRPEDVDDLVQDIFLKLQRGLPDLREDDRFGTWVYRVARNAITDYRRANGRRVLLEEASREDEPDTEIDPDTSTEAELAGYVATFVTLLPSPYREAITLTDLQGLSQKDAADMVGISLSGMKSRVQRGRRLLREALDACCAIALDARGHVIGCEARPDGPLPCCRCR